VAVREFKLPDLGEGLTEGEIVRWLVKEGDTIELNQPIVEVETAKAVVEIPAPYAGTITKLHASEGEELEVGAPLLSVDTGGAATAEAAAPQMEAAGEAQPEPEEGRQETLVGPGERQRGRRRRIGGAPAATVATATATATAPAPAGTPTPARARPKATPPVRKYAKVRGVDLAVIEGTGKDGRVTREDVDRALAPVAAAATPAPAASLPGLRVGAGRERGEDRIPIRGTRKQIAAAMTGSAFTIPHVTEFVTVDATALMGLRSRLRELPEVVSGEVKLTPLAIIAKALCVALRRFPLMNSSWDEEAGEIVVKGWVNLGIATDTPTGLLVPNVKDADLLGVLDLAREIRRLAELGRERKLAPAELTGGTITITNVGGYGVEGGTPIINRPECAILATGTIAPRPWVVDGELAVRQLMTASVSFDHRIVDGAYAARFLAHLRDLLEEPALIGMLSATRP
jgi:2-oxoisovalerate dehydrogenase E2 component (dihydrolipoyl transacylase)